MFNLISYLLSLISHKITYFILRYVMLYSVFTQGALKLLK